MGKDVTVLVIDENEGVRGLLARRLNALHPIRVVGETGSALAGLALAEFLKPEVIIADLKSRGTFTTELYKELVRASAGSSLIVHTSSMTVAEEAAAREAGVNKCLFKGISARRLASEILRVARMRPAPAG